MPTNIPECPPDFRPPRSDDRSAVYDLELITPLFGGGAEVRTNDERFPIRGSVIRGQLRFWWRATRGRVLATPAELWRREEEVFGSTDFPSPVRVEVDRTGFPPAVFESAVFGQGTAGGYALFAAEAGDRVITQGLEFRVRLTWASADRLVRQREAQNEARVKAKLKPLRVDIPDITDDLAAAVWAWVNFGGVGGRTRRGCGALRCDKLAPTAADDLPAWFRRWVAGFEHGSGAAGWPILSGRLAYRRSGEPPRDAWLNVLDLFRRFRQGTPDRNGVGRDRGRQRNRPGRSRFPEPETIREAVNRGGPRPPGQRTRRPDVPADAFPRAEFGLPIVFQLKDETAPTPTREDPDRRKPFPKTVLYPLVGTERAERMASPLILKPLALAGGKAVPIIVRLDHPPFSAVELTQDRRDNVIGNEWPPTAVRRPDLADYPDSPLAGSRSGSAIEAFLAFAVSDSGFEEVS